MKILRAFLGITAIGITMFFSAPASVTANCEGIVPGLGCLQQIRPEAGANGQTQLNNTLNSLWAKAMALVFLGLGIIGVIMLILAGIRYMSAAGNPDAVKKARTQIVSIFIGLILLGSTYTIINLIITFLYATGRV